MGEKGAEQLKKIFAFVSFIFIGFTLLVNTDPTSGDIFTKTTRTIPEPIALLLFGSVLIGLANVGRKKVFKKENDMERLSNQPAADSLNPKWAIFYALCTHSHALNTNQNPAQHLGKY